MKFGSAFVLSIFIGLPTFARDKKLDLKPKNVTAEDPHAAIHLLKKTPGNSSEKKFKNLGKETSGLNCTESKIGGNQNPASVSCGQTIQSEKN